MLALGRVLVLSALAVVGGLILGGRSLHLAGASTAVQPRCMNVQLTITPGATNGAAGHNAILYRIHNQWGSACSLYGYPGVQLLDRSFQDVPTHATRGGLVLDGRSTPSTVTVSGNGNAWFAVEYRDVPNADGSCTTATYLMVFPPNAYLPVVARASRGGGPVRACAGQITLSPVTAGHGGF